MKRKLRFSTQRETILKIVTENSGHMHADEIYLRAKERIPSLSRGTVYRNLSQLEEQKRLSKTQGPNQLSYFEAYTEPHHHFICENCSSIRDLDTPTVKICYSCISDSSDLPFQINSAAMTLFGLCEACKSPSKKEKSNELIKLHS